MNFLLIFSHLFTSLLTHSFCGCLIPNLELSFYPHLFPVFFLWPNITLSLSTALSLSVFCQYYFHNSISQDLLCGGHWIPHLRLTFYSAQHQTFTFCICCLFHFHFLHFVVHCYKRSRCLFPNIRLTFYPHLFLLASHFHCLQILLTFVLGLLSAFGLYQKFSFTFSF